MIIDILIAGFAAGVLSGLFGVGGGAIFVPALVLLFGLDQIVAEGTSLLAMIPVALLGATTQTKSGLVNWKAASTIGLIAGVGVLVGNLIAEHLDDNLLQKIFAVFVLFVAAQLARRSWTDRKNRLS